MSGFPKKETDGRGIYYACCISSIGPSCNHITMLDGTIRLPNVQPEDATALEGSWAVVNEPVRKIIATWTRGLITLDEMVSELQKVAIQRNPS